MQYDKPKDGSNGKDGINGTNGTNGTNGKDAVDGKDGRHGIDALQTDQDTIKSMVTSMFLYGTSSTPPDDMKEGQIYIQYK